MPACKVVDSWAMVAWVQDEPAAPAVEAFLQEADAGNLELLLSWYNVAETFYILAKRKDPAVAEEFLSRLPSLPLRVVLPDEDGILAAARIKAAYPVPLATPSPSPWPRRSRPALSPAITKSASAP